MWFTEDIQYQHLINMRSLDKDVCRFLSGRLPIVFVRHRFTLRMPADSYVYSDSFFVVGSLIFVVHQCHLILSRFSHSIHHVTLVARLC